jgi:hypothetical protein
MELEWKKKKKAKLLARRTPNTELLHTKRT